jgi:predicted lipoprotein with Yx(FWY)xxD motif
MNKQPNLKTIKKPLSLVGLLAIMAMILSACMTTTTPVQPPAASAPTSNPAKATGSEATIGVTNDPIYGKILVDGLGKTLYIFTVDGLDQSNCDASCLAIWPPFKTSGAPKLGPGVDASRVGTTTLADGSEIVTYDHMPLYYYTKDTQPGQTSGEDVGSVWFVISPDGKIVKEPVSSGPVATEVAVNTEATIEVTTDPKLGQFLVDGNGLTLYIFTKDGPDQSNCDASCLAKWPPLHTQGTPMLGSGVNASKIGSATLADGTRIVTYDHRPLYYFANDSKPGDMAGQGVGGVWFVISPSGAEIDNSGQLASASTPAPEAASSEPTIDVASRPSLGQYLVDGKGFTLYIFTKDGSDQSNCNASCLAKWPPLLTEGSPILGVGTDDSKIGSTLLADGRRIVTYNHMPLYYYAGDANPGDTNGQGVGSVWYVINPDGEIISN